MHEDERIAVLFFKLAGIITVWVAFAIVAAQLSEHTHIFNFLTTIIIAIAAFGTSTMLWTGEKPFSDSSEETSRKSKRGDTELESALMLLQMLDSNEREMMKKRLLNSTQQEDGELGEIIEATSRRR